MVQMMIPSIRADLLIDHRNLPALDLDSLADAVKVRRRSTQWDDVTDKMDDEDAREKAWKWVREQLDQANDKENKHDQDWERIKKFRHLRYALAQCLFFFDGTMPRW